MSSARLEIAVLIIIITRTASATYTTTRQPDREKDARLILRRPRCRHVKRSDSSPQWTKGTEFSNRKLLEKIRAEFRWFQSAYRFNTPCGEK